LQIQCARLLPLVILRDPRQGAEARKDRH